jgi:hypothetical protein
MRPDEHKKKKNALYKKKHGIQTDTKPVPGVNEGCRSVGASARTIPKGRGQLSVGVQNTDLAPGNRQPVATSVADVSEVESAADELPSRTYRRRTVESNWERYENQDVEEVTHRGADFEQVLQSARHIKPQFQFSAIHDILGGCDETVTVCDQTNFLSLDCERLAAALRCIPLCQRLDIDESVFEKSHVEVLKKEAESHRPFYEKTFGTSTVAQTDKDEQVNIKFQPVLLSTDDTSSSVPGHIVTNDLENNLLLEEACVSDAQLDVMSSNNMDVHEELGTGETLQLNLDDVIDSSVLELSLSAADYHGCELDATNCGETVPCPTEHKPLQPDSLPSHASDPRTKTLSELEDELDSLLGL